METAADVVMDTAAHHGVERAGDDGGEFRVGSPFELAQQEQQSSVGRKFRGVAESPVPGIELLEKMFAGQIADVAGRVGLPPGARFVFVVVADGPGQ